MLLAVLGANVINAAELIDGIYYNIDKSTRTASVSGSSNTTEIVIPEKVVYNDRVYAVTSIEANAFKNEAITSVSIPSSVLSIGAQAFYQCRGLNSVTIGEGCKVINSQAFYSCSNLSEIVIPGSVSIIEALTFANCQSLSNITLNEGLTYIGDYAFGALQQLTSITIPSTIINMGVTPFYNCRRLAKIVWNAKHCADFIYRRNAPFSRYSFASGPYSEDARTFVTYDDMSYYDSEDNHRTSYAYNSGYQYALSFNFGIQNTWTTSITFGNEVEHIPANLCNHFIGELRNLVIPDNVKTIGDSAFYGCTNIVSVKLGTGLTEIGKYAFGTCTNIASITFQDNLTSINPSAFSGCSSLKTIIFGKNVTNIGSYAFSGCPINSITTYVVEPPYLESSVFSVKDLINIDLNVRSDAIDAYKSADVWKEMSIDVLPTDIRTYTLTVLSNDNTMGETDPSGEKKYDEDDEVTIKALPKGGYQFSKWNDGNKENPRIIKMVGDLSYTAIFETYNPTSGNAYQVNISGENCSMNISSQYPEGSVVTIEAVPDECLEFKQWSDGNKDNPRTITVTADGNYKAEFNKITYTITGKSDSQNGQVNIVVK